jgi:group I intron endonuclease
MYGLVYCATNIISGKKYIGQTTSTLGIRKANHLSGRTNKHLARSIAKYGVDNFEWDVICEADSREDLDFWESHYISKFETTNRDKGYNIKSGGAGSKHSEDTKDLISKSKLGKPLSEHHRISISNTQRLKGNWKGGRNPNSGKGEQLRDSANPMFGKKHSEASKTKISLARKGKGSQPGCSNGMYGKTPVNASFVVLEKIGVGVLEFSSATKAAEFLGISQGQMSKIMNGKRNPPEGVQVKCA